VSEPPPGDVRTGGAPGEEPRGIYAVGTGTIAHFSDRWEASAPSRELTLPTFVRWEMPTTLAREDFRPLVQVHPREVPPELTRDLRELTPQALLRDLHRPVRQFFVELQPIEGTQVTGRLEEEFDRLRQARRVEPRADVVPTVRVVWDEQRRRQALMAEEWKPLVPDDAPRNRVQVWATAAMEEQEAEQTSYRPDFSKYDRDRGK
jgi:hypothetical protein